MERGGVVVAGCAEGEKVLEAVSMEYSLVAVAGELSGLGELASAVLGTLSQKTSILISPCVV